MRFGCLGISGAEDPRSVGATCVEVALVAFALLCYHLLECCEAPVHFAEHRQEFWSNLDPYAAQTLLAKKPDGELAFAEGMHRFEIARDQMSAALHTMQDKYTDLAIARRNLEQTQQGAAWEHFSKCRPLSKKYGLYLPCHENFKAAMQRYRGLLHKPGCPVGASLPLRPASMVHDGLEPLLVLAAPARTAETSKGAKFL